ncbi:MAG TPA: hypothetical protein VLH81_03695 [Desulfobacterales bacterium]|nr:hypothetical protein [Desulfobacterales bacterium]
MSRVKALALAAVVVLALGGCAPLFEFNLFGGLDNPPIKTLADYSGAGGLDALGEDLNSPAIVDALAADPTLVAEIKDYLWDTFIGDGGGVENEEDSQAAILYADLALKTSEGENLVNNIVEALLDGTLTGSSDIATLLASIIPPEALADAATFAAMVGALLDANDAYEQLGLYVDGDTPLGDGYWDNPLPPGSLPGDVAQKAIVAYTMAALVEAVVMDPDMAPILQPDAITQLFLVASGQPHDTDMDDIMVDPYASPDNWLLALLDVAGMRDMFEP